VHSSLQPGGREPGADEMQTMQANSLPVSATGTEDTTTYHSRITDDLPLPRVAALSPPAAVQDSESKGGWIPKP